MFFKKFRAFARVIGFATIGLLAFLGVLSLLSESNPALAAVGLVKAGPGPVRVAQAVTPTTPSTMGYLGYLEDASGNPLDGTHPMTFHIYSGAGTPLWSEPHPTVTVSSGVFYATLGSETPLPPSLFTDPSYELAIHTAFGEVLPRQRLASVPYALLAKRAAGLSASDGDPADAVTVDADGQATFTQTATFNAGAGIAGNADIGQDATIGGNAIVNGSVGVGTQPSETLVVKMGGQYWSDPHFALEAAGVSTNTWDFIVGTNDTLYMGYNESTRFQMQTDGDFVVTDGKVGIGTDSPSRKLDVSGNIITTGDVQASGDIRVGSLTVGGMAKPFKFKTMDLRVGNDTGFNVADYNCGVVGFQARDGDIQENDAGDIMRVYLYQDGLRWFVYADFRSHNNPEEWNVHIMCVSKVISQ